MSESLQSVRGMNDILPEETPYWQKIESILEQVLSAYGYRQIRFPIIEKTQLFSRSIGEVTDIVEKEMYSFDDRNGESLTLRPEGTAGCVRAAMQHGLIHQKQRLWYCGPMFRHERPQKGRYRQFHQLGVEAYGFEGPDIDTELIAMSARLWSQLSLTGLTLQINSLGSTEARLAYKEKLVAYFQQHYQVLDPDSQRRLHTNPLRILDSKQQEMQAINAAAPQLLDHLDEQSKRDFDKLCESLTRLGIEYQINPRLVRGLDYYGKTVFEWVTDKLGAQGTVCAGGRYDGLIKELTRKPGSAIGFAIGLERLIALLEENQVLPKISSLDGYLVAVGELASQQAPLFAEKIRDRLPDFKLITHCGGGSFKSQFKQADRHGARWTLILGDQEVEQRQVGIKTMATGEQQTLDWGHAIEYLHHYLDN